MGVSKNLQVTTMILNDWQTALEGAVPSQSDLVFPLFGFKFISCSLVMRHWVGSNFIFFFDVVNQISQRIFTK